MPNKFLLPVSLLCLALSSLSCSEAPAPVSKKPGKTAPIKDQDQLPGGTKGTPSKNDPTGDTDTDTDNETDSGKDSGTDKDKDEDTGGKNPVPDTKPTKPDDGEKMPDTDKPAVVDKTPSSVLDSSFISQFLEEIAGPKNAGRGTGTAENDAVAQKIAADFKKLGFKATGDNGTYLQAFSANGKPTQNIIGVLPGETDEYIVIGGHMDHLGIKSGQTYPGADDNASGTTGVMALAHALAKNTVKLKRGIIFIAFSGEEMGLLGSIHYVKKPTVPLKQIKYMINLDMIGRYSTVLEISGLERTIEGNTLGRELMGKTKLKAKYLSDAQDEGGSDHVSFRKVGIPTVSFFSGYHPEYHKPGDTTDKVNKDTLKVIAGVAGDLAFGLAKSSALTSSSFAPMLIETEGKSKGVHTPSGCEPGLVTFEELQSNLAQLDGLHVDQ